MKNINFINALTRKQQYSLRRWWLLSWVLAGGILTVAGILHGLQVHQWYVLTAEHATFKQEVDGMRSTINAHESLRKTQQTLQQKKMKSDRIRQSLASIRARLTDIAAACAASQLETCKWHKNGVEIVLGCKNALCATQCVGQLQKVKGLGSIRLVSLSPRENGVVLATMKAQPEKV
jgi:hypothetical protein